MGARASGWLPVYRVVRRIPAGQVATYGQIAALSGMPRAARQVGWALSALDDFDVVLSPDCGGGYGLIGLGAPAPELFRLEMSTPKVADETVARARALGLKARLLEPCFDINTSEDLAQLARARARGLARACPRTLAFLDARGLWPTQLGDG